MTEHNGRVVATVGIWLATAAMFIFGVFKMSWTGEIAGFFWMVVSLGICGAAGGSTAAIWVKGKSSKEKEKSPSGDDFEPPLPSEQFFKTPRQ